MAVAGLEVVMIAVILVVFLLAGPKKIPELARAIGKARAEFEKVSRENDGLKQKGTEQG